MFHPCLEHLLEDPSNSGVFVDFDGTLAPIVEDPAAARPVNGVPALLARLAERYARVVVVSGRPVDFLARVLGEVGATELIGLYGMEHRGGHPPVVTVSAGAERWRPTIEAVARAAEAQLGADPAALAGLGVERKGLSITLHFRRAPHLASWAESFAERQAALTGLRVHSGKMSVELQPPGEGDKGRVIEDLAAGLAAVCYCGDDTGDLPAFSALGRLRAAGACTVAVAAAGKETPPELVAAADLVVDGPNGVVSLLELLAGGSKVGC